MCVELSPKTSILSGVHHVKPNKDTKMKKRLRKKLKVAEFQELGFFAAGSFNQVEEPEVDIFFEKLINFADENNMQCGGGYDTEEFELFVNTGVKNSENEAQRAKMIAFMEEAKNVVKEFEVTELVDAYYSDDCHDDHCDCDCH